VLLTSYKAGGSSWNFTVIVGLKDAFMFICIRYNQGASPKIFRNVDCPQDVRLSCLRNLITGIFITYG